MATWGRNGEGYANITDGIGGRERKKKIKKKRNCRRATNANIIYERAMKKKHLEVWINV